MIDLLLRFVKLRPFDQINILRVVLWRVKSNCLYRPFFGNFGIKSFISAPILITRPDRIYIGNRVGIRQGVRLEVIQSNPARAPLLEIGDGCNIEQNVHIVCHSAVIIGSNVSITANCAIVDVTHPVNPLDPDAKIGGQILDEDSWVYIEDGVFLGIGTVVLPNVRIGKGAVIGANSVVTKDIPPFAIAAGAPAKVLRMYRTEEPQEGARESSCE
ncbi:acyltransferase [Geothrix mesophila]|uniref:acyltransferase n=1 Tax=Geothrix mesophila TaxID=2922723 RepID=UPI001FAB4F1D|nr:acyltransferase [Geothrix sp. SG198]